MVEIDQIEVINMELKEGIYIRTHQGIAKIIKRPNISVVVWNDRKVIYVDRHGYPVATSLDCFVFEDEITRASFNLIDLVEYMDLLEIENPIKLYGKEEKVSLFNPVRCDGFTEFKDGTHCIILNLDYLVNVKDLKIKSTLTKEQFNACKYVVERDK